MQRLGRHLRKITGCRKSRHYPHLYYRRLARRGLFERFLDLLQGRY